MYLLWDGPIKVDGAKYCGPVENHNLPHLHLFQRKSISADEERKIGSRRPSDS